MPFRLWHSHEHDGLHEEPSGKSYCSADGSHSPSGEFDHCGHDNHLKSTTPGCFICDFHFVENYTVSGCEYSFVDSGIPVGQGEPVLKLIRGKFSLPRNKSPPSIS